MKKLCTMFLTIAIALSLSTTTFAAPPVYEVAVGDGNIWAEATGGVSDANMPSESASNSETVGAMMSSIDDARSDIGEIIGQFVDKSIPSTDEGCRPDGLYSITVVAPDDDRVSNSVSDGGNVSSSAPNDSDASGNTSESVSEPAIATDEAIVGKPNYVVPSISYDGDRMQELWMAQQVRLKTVNAFYGNGYLSVTYALTTASKLTLVSNHFAPAGHDEATGCVWATAFEVPCGIHQDTANFLQAILRLSEMVGTDGVDGLESSHSVAELNLIWANLRLQAMSAGYSDLFDQLDNYCASAEFQI